MIVRLGLSLLLALAPAAQAAVVAARIVVSPIAGQGLAPISSAPTLTTLTPALTLMGAPRLNAPLAALSPAPSVAAAAPVQAAPRPETVLPAAVEQRFDELHAAFDERRPEEVSVGLDYEPAAKNALEPHAETAQQAHDEPPLPPAPAKGLFGFSRPLAFFLLAMIGAQVGLEAQTAGLPPLIAKIFGDVSVAADVAMVTSMAEFVGTIAAPIAAKKLGIKGAYVWSAGLRVVTSGLIAGLLAANCLSMTGLVALVAVDGLMLGVTYTLEKSIPAIMVDQDQAKLEKYKAVRQTAMETVGAIVPIATGAVVAAFGFMPALLAFPLAMAASMTLVAITLRLPAKISGMRSFTLPGPLEDSIPAHFNHLGRSAAKILRTPALLYSLLAYAFVYAPTPIIYWLLAPAFGLHLAGSATVAAAYAGMISGLYSLGGVIASVFVMRQQRQPRSLSEMTASMLRWTVASAAALVLFGSLALPGLSWGTITLPALAMILFAVPQVSAKLKLESYFQSRAPKGAVDDATAILEGATSVMITLGLWWFGKMLAGANITSLAWLAAAALPLGLPLLALAWALARALKRP